MTDYCMCEDGSLAEDLEVVTAQRPTAWTDAALSSTLGVAERPAGGVKQVLAVHEGHRTLGWRLTAHWPIRKKQPRPRPLGVSGGEQVYRTMLPAAGSRQVNTPCPRRHGVAAGSEISRPAIHTFPVKGGSVLPAG